MATDLLNTRGGPHMAPLAVLLCRQYNKMVVPEQCRNGCRNHIPAKDF
jgi:hypothetical protein